MSMVLTDPDTRSAAARLGSVASGRQGRWVLLLEDEPLLLRLFGRLLRSAGFRVVATGDPHEALQALARPSVKVDLMVVDVVLPGMSGPQFVLRANRRAVPVVYVTGHDAQGAGLPEGAHVLQKPFDGSLFTATVRRLASAPRSGVQVRAGAR